MHFTIIIKNVAAEFLSPLLGVSKNSSFGVPKPKLT